jgi:hypothetical protein
MGRSPKRKLESQNLFDSIGADVRVSRAMVQACVIALRTADPTARDVLANVLDHAADMLGYAEGSLEKLRDA